MFKKHSGNNLKKLGLCLAVLVACSSNVLAANDKHEKDKPAGPAPHAENNAQSHGVQRANAVRGGAPRRDDARAHYAFHGRDVHGFNHADLERWRGGRWRNTCFNGRCGNWWFAGGEWYFYDQQPPVYPYPLVVSQVEYVEPVAVVPVPVPAPAPLRVAPPPKFWYYCDNPRGYYPSVATCSTQFHQVTTPPPH